MSRAALQPIPWEDLEPLLLRVQKPGRYVGGEYNLVRKPWEAVEMRVCLAFPDLYDLGMSNFAFQIFYALLNAQPWLLAERAYLPAPDMQAALRQAGLPLYSLESRHPLAAFDLLAVSTAYEQLFTGVLSLLDLAGLPLPSAERDERYPLVLGGGHGAFNPEPISEFVDAFVIGEGEDVLLDIAQVLREVKAAPRAEQLKALARIPGVYVPSLYRVTYRGLEVAAIEPLTPAAPLPIARRVVSTPPPTPIRQLVPNVEIAHERAVIEIQRGCTRGCRFRQAGMVTRPVRERPMEQILAEAEQVIAATGYEELALLSLSSADHSQIEPTLNALRARFAGRHLSLSLPSLRIDAFSVELADALSSGRKTGFTFAPEAGSETLRQRINKDIRTEDLLQVAETVFARGWRTIKLYFMLGLPGETDADVEAMAELALEVWQRGRKVHGRNAEVHLTVGTFVPKAWTPFQWEPLAAPETIARRQALLRERIRTRAVHLSWNDYRETRLEALLSRGDRRLNAVIERAWRLGAQFDAWDEWRNFAAWDQALAETGLDEAAYLYTVRPVEASLPWDHLTTAVDKRFLLREKRLSEAGQFSRDCRAGCLACGILTHVGAAWSLAWQCPPPAHQEGA